MTDFNTNLEKNHANYRALSPIDFIVRNAEVFPDREAIVHGHVRRTWKETFERCKSFASALRQFGVKKDVTVACLLPNTPAMVEAHFAVPMSGGVLLTLNTRLEKETLHYCLEHSETKVLVVDSEFIDVLEDVRERFPSILIVQVNDHLGPPASLSRFADYEYESFLASSRNPNDWVFPEDEWDAIALNYTSGTTGKPKGVVYHHRGAHLNAISNILEWELPKHPVYLWTLPLFHCNGWCYAWSVAARAGVNVCLRRIDAGRIFDLIRREKVTHYCAAPIVHQLLAEAPDEIKEGVTHTVKGLIGGAPPPCRVLESLEAVNISITHAYGLTETFGPAVICEERPDWADLPREERCDRKSRQGVRNLLQGELALLDPEEDDIPLVGEEAAKRLGEILLRGNTVMKGYLKDPEATRKAFQGGWFHTGDLAVKEEDGYVRVVDRSKDVIISGGENISSVEVENALYRHPDVAACAVVGAPHCKWGEVPVAFVELRQGASWSEEAAVKFLRQSLAGFKTPKRVVFTEIPKTATNKVQKFQLKKLAREFFRAAA